LSWTTSFFPIYDLSFSHFDNVTILLLVNRMMEDMTLMRMKWMFNILLASHNSKSKMISLYLDICGRC